MLFMFISDIILSLRCSDPITEETPDLILSDYTVSCWHLLGTDISSGKTINQRGTSFSASYLPIDSCG